MENFNRVLNSSIMGNANLSRFYLGLRGIEKTKARDAKLSQDSGGSSKPNKKSKVVVRNSWIYDAEQDLTRGVINAEEFLMRLTSEYDGFCNELNDCSVALLYYFEIDEQPIAPQQDNESNQCQFCENSLAIVVLGCRCQKLCVPCFFQYANIFTDVQREFDTNGQPIVNEANPLQCPHCRVFVNFYVIARR